MPDPVFRRTERSLLREIEDGAREALAILFVNPLEE